MTKKLISHEEVMRIARQDPEFIREERKINVYFELAKQVYQMRKKTGMSQIDLAKKSKTYQTRISKIENAELNANLSTIISIAEALDCEVTIEFKKCKDIREEALENNNYFWVKDFENEKSALLTENKRISAETKGDYVTI